MKLKAQLFNEEAVNRAITRIAHEIIERNETTDNLVLVGIKTRGVPFALRLSEVIYNKIDNSKKLSVGILDITPHRDDLKTEQKGAENTQSYMPESIEGKTVIITDDVMFTGRTARAALDALIKFGRPAKIQLAVMVDRGHRELPIRPDYVGKNIPTSKSETIRVRLNEVDEKDSIEIYEL